MATLVPAPVLDARNGDLVVAEAIGSLPSELSDRSNSNPAVVFLEAAGAMFDKILFQLNNWPQAVIQKVLNLCGITLIPATAATVQQTFTLTAPQPQDSVVPAGTQAGTSDGTLVFSTLANLTIRAYAQPSGTIALTAGSTSVVGTGTTFTSDVQVGYQISTNAATWYTVASIASDTALTLTTSASSTVSATAYYSGGVSGTTAAQCTTAGLITNVGSGQLTTLITQPAGVGSTNNGAAATGGTDLETTTAAIARAPQAFATRDIACQPSDYEYFALKILGANGRAKGFANTNLTQSAASYVTLAMLSPAWTTASTVSSQERASVVRDLSTRSFSGATLVDTAALLQRFDVTPNIPTIIAWRKAQFDQVSCALAIAGAVNTLLNPNTYSWGRTIYTTDLVGAVEALPQIDRVHTVNGIPAVATNYQTTTNAVSVTQGSTSATANAADIGSGKITANVTYLIDAASNNVVLVTGVSGTTLTLSSGWIGATTSATLPYFNVGDTPLTTGYTLPYSNLSTVTAPPSIIIIGSV